MTTNTVKIIEVIDIRELTVEGSIYKYMAEWPEGRKGGLYRLHKFTRQVPNNQSGCTVEGITGPDAGKWFWYSDSNFISRFKRVE